MLYREVYYLKKMKTLFLRIFLVALKTENIALKNLSTGSDLSASEMHTLVAIGRGTPKTMTELAQELLINVSTLSIAINKLKKKGYVRRIRNESDRRIVRVSLTAKGKQALSEHENFYFNIIRSMSDGMTDEEKRSYIKMLTHVEKALTDMLPD